MPRESKGELRGSSSPAAASLTSATVPNHSFQLAAKEAERRGARILNLNFFEQLASIPPPATPRMLASTSKALWRTASSTPRLLRPLTTASAPSPSPVAPSPPTLPGFALPEAFRAPTSLPTSTPTPAPNVVGPYWNRIAQGHPYKLHVYSSRNNTILTLSTVTEDPTDPQRAVSWVSAGSAGYKGASRGTYDAAVEVSLRMFKKIEEMVTPVIGSGGQRKKVGWAKPGELEIVWKGFGQGRDAVFRTLMGGEGDLVRPLVKTVTDAVSLPCGGCEARELMRVLGYRRRSKLEERAPGRGGCECSSTNARGGELMSSRLCSI